LLTPWELKNPEGVDFSLPEHDPDIIPDKWFCEVWDNIGPNCRSLRFHYKNREAHNSYGNGASTSWGHFRMIPAEDWPEWAREAWEELTKC
jgi:hypothetical protein